MYYVDIYVNGTKKFDSSNVSTFSLNRYSSSAVAPEFGNVSAGELTLSIDATTTQNTIAKGDSVSFELYDSDAPQTIIQSGDFIATQVTDRNYSFDVTCLDRMIELDVEANLSGVTYPITAINFINQVFGGLGMTVSISNRVYGGVTLNDPTFPVGATYRQVLSKVCECMGANAWYTDVLNIGWYEPSTTVIEDTEYFTLDIAKEGYDVSVEVTDDVSALPVEIGNTIVLRVVANPFLAGKTATEKTAIATAIKTNIGTVNWYGATSTILPMPELSVMDIVQIDNKAVPLTSVTIGINENSLIEGKITTDENIYNGARALDVIQKEVSDVQEEVEEQSKHFFYRDDSGVHITMVENDWTTGKNVLIDSDSLDIRDDTETIASFRENTLIGREYSNRLSLGDKGLILYGLGNDEIFAVKAETTGYAVREYTDVLATMWDYYDGYIKNSLWSYPNTGLIRLTVNGEVISPELYTYTLEDDGAGHTEFTIYYSEFTRTDEIDIMVATGGDYDSSLNYGRHNSVTGNGAVALGEGLIASADSQVVIGKYNEASTERFVIGNGSGSVGSDARSNVFSISDTGDVSLYGNREIKFASSYGGTLGKGTISAVDGLTLSSGTGDINLNAMPSTVKIDGYEAYHKGNLENATTSNDGLMSSTDKAKLNKVAPQSGITAMYFGDGTKTEQVFLWGNDTNKVGVGAHNTIDNKRYNILARTTSLILGNQTDGVNVWSITGLDGSVDINNNKYKAGDSISFSASVPAPLAGFVTNSTRSLDLQIPLPKDAMGLTATLNLNASNGLSVRVGTSGYLNGTQYINTSSGYTITATPNVLGVYVRITGASAYTNITNNTSCTGVIVGTLTFS